MGERWRFRWETLRSGLGVEVGGGRFVAGPTLGLRPFEGRDSGTILPNRHAILPQFAPGSRRWTGVETAGGGAESTCVPHRGQLPLMEVSRKRTIVRYRAHSDLHVATHVAHLRSRGSSSVSSQNDPLVCVAFLIHIIIHWQEWGNTLRNLHSAILGMSTDSLS